MGKLTFLFNNSKYFVYEKAPGRNATLRCESSFFRVERQRQIDKTPNGESARSATWQCASEVLGRRYKTRGANQRSEVKVTISFLIQKKNDPMAA